MIRRVGLVALALLLNGALQPAAAQGDGTELTVYLMTMGPGDLVFERFGHDGLWIQDASTGTSIFYNWGVFSFSQPGFLQRFLKGRMLYWMEPWDATATVNGYAKANRTVWVQELNLTPAQRLSLKQFVDWNALPENKFYRYDYYRDNCTTRLRDALDRALGGQLRRALEPRSSTETYRTHTQKLMYTDLPIYTGLMVAMGPFIDQPLNAWEESFLPFELQEWVRAVTITGADGKPAPLVVSERTLFQSTRPAPADQAPGRMAILLTLGLVWAAILLLLAGWGTRARIGRVLFFTVASLGAFVVGLVGTIIALLWAFTDHVVTYSNENVLQANVLSLVLLVALIAMALGKAWGLRYAFYASLAVAGFATMGFMLQVLPGLDQVNGEVIALLLPPHLALAWLIGRRRAAELGILGGSAAREGA